MRYEVPGGSRLENVCKQGVCLHTIVFDISATPWNLRVDEGCTESFKVTPLRFDSIVCHACPGDEPLGDADRRA